MTVSMLTNCAGGDRLAVRIPDLEECPPRVYQQDKGQVRGST